MYFFFMCHILYTFCLILRRISGGVIRYRLKTNFILLDIQTCMIYTLHWNRKFSGMSFTPCHPYHKICLIWNACTKSEPLRYQLLRWCNIYFARFILVLTWVWIGLVFAIFFSHGSLLTLILFYLLCNFLQEQEF